MTKSKKKDEKKNPAPGASSEDLRTSLERTFDEAEWAWIKPHADRGIVIIVDTFLELIQVGEAIAQDRSLEVQKWIDQNLLTKPTLHKIAVWDANPKTRFLCLIVQPYILIQDLRNTEVKH